MTRGVNSQFLKRLEVVGVIERTYGQIMIVEEAVELAGPLTASGAREVS